MAKAHIPHSGWPIRHETLFPWYADAHRWLQIDKPEYYEGVAPDFASQLLPSEYGVTTKYFRFSPPTRFGEVYLHDVSEQSQLHCVLNATAVQLSCASDGRATSLTARSLDGEELTVRAEQFVVAMGGIENARFLLACADENKSIPWQTADWLGRGFMDHAGWQVGQVLARADLRYQQFGAQPDLVMPVLAIEEELLATEGLINCCLMLKPVPKITGIDSAYALNPWVTKQQSEDQIGGYRASIIWEPSPCRTSRITLSDRRDSLGVRRLNLHWDFNANDFKMLDASISHLNRYLHLTHSGRLKLEKPVNQKTMTARIGNGWHHMGTTRMSANTETGVVDEHCRIHQSPNVYVAGSSVFPSVGFSNPTLTITALACRLAAHLAGDEDTV
jgi:choline dehydrogenase-like flavoprotein